jgi:hypothetical protein
MQKRNIKGQPRLTLLGENGIKVILTNKSDSSLLSLFNGINLEQV